MNNRLQFYWTLMVFITGLICTTGHTFSTGPQMESAFESAMTPAVHAAVSR